MNRFTNAGDMIYLIKQIKNVTVGFDKLNILMMFSLPQIF